ncbi:MAG TPA: PKD domain-containing protein, partial [Halobacteriales archaeon]|nr:PKD domain-containing protein [Halobacteriales archaeon]
ANGVDTDGKYVFATITEFSVFAPMNGTTDITPPQVEAGDDRMVLVDSPVSFSADVSDDRDDDPDVVWDFGDGATASGVAVDHAFDSADTFEVTVTATDDAGNSATDALDVTVLAEDLEPPVVDAGEDRTVLNGTLVHFDATVSDDLGIASIEWDFGDGSIDVVEDPTHVFSDDGVYHVTLTVTDVGGNAVTDVVNVTVIDEDVTAPTAEAGDPIVTAIDLETTFDASASSDDIGIVSYTWDFGDGSEPVTNPGPVVTHVYDEVYEDGITATLTVEDAAGHTASDTVEVTVGEHLDEETLQPGPIDGFGVIETPGYYYLTTDLDGYGTVGTALEVKVGDVEIDGRGHSIVNGVNESIHILGTGSANSLENVTVRDLTISDWETAISAMNVKNSTFEELRLVENHDAGLVLASAGSAESTADNRIVDSRFEDNEKGVVVRNSVTRTTIGNSWFVENHEAGLKVEAASYTTVLGSNFVGQDGEKAIHVTGTSPNNWFEGNTVEDSVGGVENAIHIGGESGNNTLIDNVVRNNVEGGISIGAGDNTLRDNEIYGNGLTGVALEGDGNVLSGNEIYGNDVGLLLAGLSASADLESNAIYSNAAWDVRAIEGASADAEDLDLGSDTVVSFELTDVALARGTDPGVAGYEGIGAFVEAENTSAAGELYLEVPYSGADVASIDESALRMWRYDETGGWEIVGPVVWFDDGDGWYADADPAENGVNLDEGYVYATITEFSVFAPLVGDIDEPDADLAIVEAALASDDVTFGDPIEANGTIENNGTEAATVRLALTVDGEVVDSQLVTVPAGGDAAFEFVYAGFAAPGSYEVAVSGYDLGTVAVVDRTPPVPDAGGDRTVVVNQPVAFDASASTDDVGIVDYDWTIGENETFLSDEQAFSHTFDEVGEYEVVLTVADAAGNEASDAVTVTVEADTEPPTAVIVVSPTTGVAGEPMTFDAS